MGPGPPEPITALDASPRSMGALKTENPSYNYNFGQADSDDAPQ
jgi:hypothetical protein